MLHCLKFHSHPHQYSLLFPLYATHFVFIFVYPFSWVNIARLINFAHDFTFDSNRMSRDAVNRVFHTSHRVKTSSGCWLSRIPLQCLWLKFFFFHESVAKQNVNWLISRKLKSRDAKSSHKFTWFSVCARLIVRSPHMNAAKSWEKSFIVLSKVKFQLINCCVMASKFIQFTFIGQWLRTLIFNSNDNDEKETKSKYFRFVSVFD